MTLIKVRHYYDNGAGINVGDVWSEINNDEAGWQPAETGACR